MNPKEQEQKPITNDLPTKIIMKNCPKFRAQILSDITKIPESKFIDTEFLDTHLPLSLERYCIADLAFKIGDEQIVTTEFYTSYTEGNDVKDSLYTSCYKINLYTDLKNKKKSTENVNVTQVVFYPRSGNIGNFLIQKQRFHNKKIKNHISEIITRYTINLDNLDNIKYTKSVKKRLLRNLKFLASDRETQKAMAEKNKLWKEVINVIVRFDENGQPIQDLDLACYVIKDSLINDGKKAEQKRIINNMYKKGMSIEEISNTTEIPINKIKEALNT